MDIKAGGGGGNQLYGHDVFLHRVQGGNYNALKTQQEAQPTWLLYFSFHILGWTEEHEGNLW